MKGTHRRLWLAGLLIAAGPAMLVGQAPSDRPDLDAVARITTEGTKNSSVMEIAAYLSDVHGPRLTGSPNLKAAAEYARDQMTAWGLTNVALEPWGPAMPGWTNDRFVALAVKPHAYPLLGAAKAWTPGLDAPVIANAVMAVIQTEADFEKFRGKLKGAFALIAPLAEVDPTFTPSGARFSDAELAELAKPIVRERNPGTRDPVFSRKRNKFFIDEGVAAVLEPGRGGAGTFFVESGVASRDPRDFEVPTMVVLAAEHYNRIARTIARGVPVTLELDVRNTFYQDDLNSFTVIGEIAGSDKASELVMIGAHLDSWHAGTGATDNAAGVAVVLEAMRILKASGLKPRRTIRVALWTGEEQGRLGSRAYVRKHFGNPATLALAPEHEQLSAYFNLDMGAGAIRGVYLQGNESVAPIFRAWMKPFEKAGMTTLSIRDMGGTDHTSFDEIGLPGFQFIQDPLEYAWRSHHFNMDLFERIPSADMIHNAVVVAAFAYHAANRDEKLPRKPLRKPDPEPNKTAAAPGRSDIP